MADKYLSDVGNIIRSTLYAEPNTNPFTDALQTKLNGIEANATADQTGTEIVSLLDTEIGNSDWQTDTTYSDLSEFNNDSGFITGVAWGDITGTLANQTELSNALDNKANSSSLATVATSGDSSDLNNNANFVPSDASGVTGADTITNIISLTQAEYDAISTPDASTLYYITD